MTSGFNSELNIAGSYYTATASAFAPAPRLDGERIADICVVGGGYTGLAAALAAAEAGLSVILLEAGRIGWGSSGRNGGQIIPGLRKGAAELVKLYGPQAARAIFTLALSARDRVLARIEKHAIACDAIMNGHLTLAAKPADLAWMREEVEALETHMNYRHARVLGVDETCSLVNAPGFHGGLRDDMGGHMHPLNYALGLADAARAVGVALYEHSAALSVEQGQGVRVATATGLVQAKACVLACDAYLGDLDARLAARIMPVANYLVATEPLAYPEKLIAHQLAVSDSRFVVNYFRLSEDGRLIFGGGERYTPDPPADIAAFVRRHLERVFPQLKGVRIEHAWGGLVSITMTRLPHVGRIGDMYFAHGYSGQGAAMATLAGEVLAEAIGGKTDRFDLLAHLAPPRFPGGSALRAPLHVAGMAWYALRDRL